MITTPSPLTEKLTLFWHDHFVSAQQKVRIAHLMYRQNQMGGQFTPVEFVRT